MCTSSHQQNITRASLRHIIMQEPNQAPTISHVAQHSRGHVRTQPLGQNHTTACIACRERRTHGDKHPPTIRTSGKRPRRRRLCYQRGDRRRQNKTSADAEGEKKSKQEKKVATAKGQQRAKQARERSVF